MTKRSRNHIGDNLYCLRVDLGLSQAQIAEMAQVAQTTVSSWECGQCTPRFDNLMNLVDKLGIDYDLLASEESGYAFKTRNKRHARKSTDPFSGHSRKKAASAIGETFAPIVATVSAGPMTESRQIEGLFPVPSALKKRHPNAFFLRIEGESMNRRLPNGCLALVDPNQREVDEHGAFAIRTEGSETTVKRIRKRPGGVELVPDSSDPSFKPLVFPEENGLPSPLFVLGRVVWMTAPLDYEV